MNKAHNTFEIIVGTFVLFCAVFFFFTSFKSAKVRTNGVSYHLIAKFDNVDGIASGSDVKISGVKVGSIQEQYLDPKDFRATLVIGIMENIPLSADTSAKIASEGLLGSKYLALSPGGDEENLKDGDEIMVTQSSVNLEDLLGKFIFSSSEKNTSNEKK